MKQNERLPEQREAPPLMAEPRERDPDQATHPLVTIAGLGAIVGLFAWLWIGAGFAYFTIVVGLVVMITLHELGHFLTARWSGMKATQFFLFFGPRIASFHRKGVEYGVRLIPAGAYVRIIGMTNLDPIAPEDEPYAYRNSTYPRKMWVITAGSVMHFIQAIILFTVLAVVVGSPDRSSGWSIDSLAEMENNEAAPAAIAGLEPGDSILRIDDQETATYQDLIDYVSVRPDEMVNVVVEREGETQSFDIVLAGRGEGAERSGFLGVRPEFEVVDRNAVNGVKAFGEVSWLSIKGVAQLPVLLVKSVPLVFEGSEEVSVTSAEASERPVSLVGVVRFGGSNGFDWSSQLALLAFINVFVGWFNLVPLLPFDGGHAAIATYERIRSRNGRRYQADIGKAVPIFYGTLVVLAVMFFSSIWLDIARPIS